MKLPTPRKLPSGSWFVRVMVNGESIPITRDTKAECQKAAAAVKTGAQYEKPKKGTLKQACDKYISDRENVLSASTIAGYRKIARTMFQASMNAQLSSLTNERLQQIVNAEAKRVSAKTVRNSWGFISSVITSETGTRPAVRLPQVVANDLPFLDSEQLPKFMDAINGDSMELQILLGLHGLRRSEILAMTYENIDIAKKLIHVHGAAVQGDDGLVYQKANKNATSRRSVPIMIPRLIELVKAVPSPDRTGLIYRGDPHKIYKHLDSICEKNGLPHISVHSLRRTFASLALHAGVSEAACQKLGGWSDPQTMKKIYQKISDKDVSDQAQKIADIFNNL